VVTVSDPAHGLAMGVGVLAAAVIGLGPTRRARVRGLVIGLLAGVSIYLGAVLSAVPVLAVVALFALSVGSALLASRSPLGGLMLGLIVPLVAIGLSYSDLGKAAGIAALMATGSAYAFVVSLVWPRAEPDPVPVGAAPASVRAMLDYGARLGLALSVAAAVGFALDLEHVGWAAGAAALVMRPDARLLRSRGIDRVVSVATGALIACVLVLASPPDWLLAVVVLVDLTLLAATRRSRWYLAGGFNTLVVFLMLLVGSPDEASHRFWERVGETALGVALAFLFGVVVPAFESRRLANR
jgi:hypothetical protein